MLLVSNQRLSYKSHQQLWTVKRCQVKPRAPVSHRLLDRTNGIAGEESISFNGPEQAASSSRTEPKHRGILYHRRRSESPSVGTLPSLANERDHLQLEPPLNRSHEHTVPMAEYSEAPALPLAEKSSADLGESEDKTLPASEITAVLEQLNSSTEESQTQSQDPPSEWDILRTQLDEKPHDADGWRRLVEIAESSGDLEQIKKTYEALLITYPHTVRVTPLQSLIYAQVLSLSSPQRR
jgi:hypothetical protein